MAKITVDVELKAGNAAEAAERVSAMGVLHAKMSDLYGKMADELRGLAALGTSDAESTDDASPTPKSIGNADTETVP